MFHLLVKGLWRAIWTEMIGFLYRMQLGLGKGYGETMLTVEPGLDMIKRGLKYAMRVQVCDM